MRQWFKTLDPFWQRSIVAIGVALLLLALNGIAGLLD